MRGWPHPIVRLPNDAPARALLDGQLLAEGAFVDVLRAGLQRPRAEHDLIQIECQGQRVPLGLAKLGGR